MEEKKEEIEDNSSNSNSSNSNYYFEEEKEVHITDDEMELFINLKCDDEKLKQHKLNCIKWEMKQDGVSFT